MIVIIRLTLGYSYTEEKHLGWCTPIGAIKIPTVLVVADLLSIDLIGVEKTLCYRRKEGGDH